MRQMSLRVYSYLSNMTNWVACFNWSTWRKDIEIALTKYYADKVLQISAYINKNLLDLKT